MSPLGFDLDAALAALAAENDQRRAARAGGKAARLAAEAAPPCGPCEACRHADRCGSLRLACDSFALFVRCVSEERWNIAPRVPTRERFVQVLGED